MNNLPKDLEVERFLKNSFAIDNGEIQLKYVIETSKDVFSATVIFSYLNNGIEIIFEGSTLEKIKESFTNAVNQELEDMVDHLGDCMLV